MNLYIWKYVEHLTDSHHNTGVVAVIAESLARALELIPHVGKQDLDACLSDESCDGWANCPHRKSRESCDCKPLPDPERFSVVTTEERVWVFPNPGCC